MQADNVKENGSVVSEPLISCEKHQQDVSVIKWKQKNVNPFVHKLPLNSMYDYFKLLFMSIFILPIRLLIILICLLIASTLAFVGMCGLSEDELAAKPLTGWRRMAKNQVCLWVRFLYVGFGFHFVPVKGRQAGSREAPILVVAPHSTMFDALPVVVMGAPSIIAKGEVQEVPFFARYINFTQPVYVWRENTNSRQTTIEEIKRRATSEDDWPQVMIFPEGTCTNRSCLITFKPGAFYPAVPVQPVVIRYPNQTDCMTWTWDGPGAAKMLWVALCQFHNYCQLEFLPVYHPSAEEKRDPRLFAANVRQVMANSLGLPVMDYTYDDCRVMHKARLKKLPRNTGLIEFQKLKHKYVNLSLSEVEGELMDQFASIATRTNGMINLENFAHYLGIPATDPAMLELFKFYDRDGCDLICFRDFVIARCEIKQSSSNKVFSETFKFFDQKGEDCVCVDTFIQVLDASLRVDSKTAERLFHEVDSDAKGYLIRDDFSTLAQRNPDYIQLFFLYQNKLRESQSSEILED